MGLSHIVALTELPPGGCGRIASVRSGPGLRHRLESMGLRAGEMVAKISGLPLRGPVVVQVGGTRIALGHGMAEKVAVETGKAVISER